MLCRQTQQSYCTFAPMIKYSKWKLSNGLRVIFYRPKDRSQATVNVLYNVGARDEHEERTGFAHLFEHLMFSGSANIESYDAVVENAGGSNNAYTTNDLTNYFIKLPKENLETALWLESDRMMSLNINEESLSIQKGVVIEEFKQRCYNGAFGLLWHDVRKLIHKNHPYRWPTIGLSFDHIADSTLKEVQSFYDRFYNPNNAIVCIAADIEEDKCKLLVDKWFGSIENMGSTNQNTYPMEAEPVNTDLLKAEDLNPHLSVILSWRIDNNLSDNFVRMSAFAEMFAEGHKSYLVKKLIKEEDAFNSTSMFVSPGNDYSIVLFYGILNPGYTHDQGKEKMIKVLQEAMESNIITKKDLELFVNMNLYSIEKWKTEPSSVAEYLCKYEALGQIELVNSWSEKYKALTLEDCLSEAKATLSTDNMSTIYYSPKK